MASLIESVDCVVIGAGVVGLAVARALALQGREVLLHVAPYAGVPASVVAFRAAAEWMAAEGLGLDTFSASP